MPRPLLPPRLPTLPGFDLAARYLPHTAEEHVSGDFYDVFTGPDGRHVIVLGDVCGKCPAAAAITGLVRHTIWVAAQHSADPAQVLPLVNCVLRRERTLFCTLVFLLLTPAPGVSRPGSTSCPRGTPPRSCARSTVRQRSCRATAHCSASSTTSTSPPVTVILDPGDSLIAYTDGFTEGAGRHDQRESEDLTLVLARNHAHTADASSPPS